MTKTSSSSVSLANHHQQHQSLSQYHDLLHDNDVVDLRPSTTAGTSLLQQKNDTAISTIESDDDDGYEDLLRLLNDSSDDNIKEQT